MKVGAQPLAIIENDTQPNKPDKRALQWDLESASLIFLSLCFHGATNLDEAARDVLRARYLLDRVNAHE